MPSPSTPALPRRALLPLRLFHTTPTPSPPQEDNPHGYLNPIGISPDMFFQSTPRPILLTVRNDLFPAPLSDPSFSPSLVQLSPHHPSSEHNILIVGIILNNTECFRDDQSETMEWWNDGNDEEMQMHMDVYEGWGSDYDGINEKMISNIKY